jgi:hypothetical protein
MEISGWVVLAVLWALLNLLTRKAEKSSGKSRRPPETDAQPEARPLPHTLDASQREGSRLETMLRELQRTLEEASAVDALPTLTRPRTGPLGRPATVPLPTEEEFEERASLEVEPEVESLETEVRRESRRRVDQDEGAEEIVARRISAAAARDKAITQADHAAFDQRIRQEVADKTATRFSARQLRDAVVWREILGPPVSLREDSEK